MKSSFCRLTIIVSALFSSGCGSYIKQESDKVGVVDFREIPKVIEAIIVQDSLNVWKSDIGSPALCDSMKKVEIYILSEETLSSPILIPSMAVSLYHLLRTQINERPFFKREDSTHLVSQYSEINSLRIDEATLKQVNVASFRSYALKKEEGEQLHYYTISLPLFSLDGTKAFVQVGHHCGFLCGNGKDIYLRKDGGLWRVVASYETWIS